MLRRLKRPGYWIVALIVLTVYFYHSYREHEAQQRRQALLRLYQSYGESLLDTIRDQNLSALQNAFAPKGKERISLEEIATFVTTLHLERNPSARWQSWEEKADKVTLHGKLSLEGNLSYPIDMMLVKRGDEVVLDRMRVGPKTLQLRPSSFPLNAVKGVDENATAPKTTEAP